MSFYTFFILTVLLSMAYCKPIDDVTQSTTTIGAGWYTAVARVSNAAGYYMPPVDGVNHPGKIYGGVVTVPTVLAGHHKKPEFLIREDVGGPVAYNKMSWH